MKFQIFMLLLCFPAIKSNKNIPQWLPCVRWKCANGSTCLVQSFVRRRSQVTTEKGQVMLHSSNSANESSDQNYIIGVDSKYEHDYLEMLHEVVQGPATINDFFSPPSIEVQTRSISLSQMKHCGTLQVKTSEFWYSMLLQAWNNLLRGDKFSENSSVSPQLTQAAYLDYHESVDDEHSVLVSKGENSTFCSLTTGQLQNFSKSSLINRGCMQSKEAFLSDMIHQEKINRYFQSIKESEKEYVFHCSKHMNASHDSKSHANNVDMDMKYVKGFHSKSKLKNSICSSYCCPHTKSTVGKKYYKNEDYPWGQKYNYKLRCMKRSCKLFSELNIQLTKVIDRLAILKAVSNSKTHVTATSKASKCHCQKYTRKHDMRIVNMKKLPYSKYSKYIL